MKQLKSFAEKPIYYGNLRYISDEYLYLSNLQHPNVVRLFGLYIAYDDESYMVMELVPKGSLKKLLSRDPSIFTPNDLLDM